MAVLLALEADISVLGLSRGTPMAGPSGLVGIPVSRDRIMTTSATLRSGSCATSSVTKRKWLQSGETMHHIIGSEDRRSRRSRRG